jgi:hypothetical protein
VRKNDMGKPFELEAEPWLGETEFGANLGASASAANQERIKRIRRLITCHPDLIPIAP